MTRHPLIVPTRFQNAVVAHVVMNVIEVPGLQTPLILGIHGPAGEGKTEQCRFVFDKMGVKLEWLFADMFENKQAGEPIGQLKTAYKTASEFNRTQRAACKKGNADGYHKLCILFINDIDQRLGRSDSLIQQTINTQLLNACLMELADRPDDIDHTPVTRVPIVITGNNLATLYSPLRRDGRMVKFEWIPTHDEKAEMVRSIFPESSLSEKDIQILVSEFSTNGSRPQGKSTAELTVSSYASVRYELYKEEIIKMITEIGLEHVLEYVLRGQHKERLRHPLVTLDSVREKARSLLRAGILQNHLRI